jgi:hypothetical protein
MPSPRHIRSSGNRAWLLFACILVGAWFTGRAAAQPGVYSLDTDRQPVVLLNGLMRFHSGDDPAWALASADDSAWPLIPATDGWSNHGYPNYSGVGWYRARVSVPANSPPLSIYICCVRTNYQVFADGVLIGGAGEMPPHPVAYEIHPRVYRLPPPASAEHEGVAREIVLAIRVWHWPHLATTYSGGLHSGIRIGANGPIDQFAAMRIHDDAWNVVAALLLTILDGLAGLAGVALYSLRRKEPEYLCFGISMTLYAVFRSVVTYQEFHQVPYQLFNILWYCADLSTSLANVALYYFLLKGRKDRYLVTVLISLAALFLVGMAENYELIGQTLFGEISTGLRLPMTIWVLALVIRRAWQGLADARLLLIPLLVSRITLLIDIILSTAFFAGWYRGDANWYYATSQWPFPFMLGDLADGLFLVGMLAILIYRFTRTSRQGERLANELEAARTVQQVLFPDEIPGVPGFVIASVYKPAGQVGGDFFQILPIAQGAVLLVVGDVSGKGMPAAMTVALIVGSARTLAESTESPGEILAGLNRRLCGRPSGGFTTCLVLRVDPGGRITMANAGHLAPYRDGVELPVESGLPLGLAPKADFTESQFQLGTDEQLTLVTDGVVEARSKSGELFGFERTLELSRETAEKIVEAAQAFGQEDDITALTLRLA